MHPRPRTLSSELPALTSINATNNALYCVPEGAPTGMLVGGPFYSMPAINPECGSWLVRLITLTRGS